MLKVKNIKLKLLISLCIMAYAALLYFTPLSCPILSIFNIPCPGCGMTRALFSLLRFDFKSAFNYHPMFWSVPLLFLCFIFDGKLFAKKWINTSLYIFVIFGYIINWLYVIFVK